jgi:hypothetical protein
VLEEAKGVKKIWAEIESDAKTKVMPRIECDGGFL